MHCTGSFAFGPSCAQPKPARPRRSQLQLQLHLEPALNSLEIGLGRSLEPQFGTGMTLVGAGLPRGSGMVIRDRQVSAGDLGQAGTCGQFGSGQWSVPRAHTGVEVMTDNER